MGAEAVVEVQVEVLEVLAEVALVGKVLLPAETERLTAVGVGAVLIVRQSLAALAVLASSSLAM